MFRNLINKIFGKRIRKNVSYGTRLKHLSLSEPADSVTSDRIVWMDMEMTGLDVNTNRIMEVACLITDADLKIIAEGPDIILHQSNEVLTSMAAWCKDQHGKSGLSDACLNSKVTVEQAEQMLLDFISKYVNRGTAPLAGNTIYMDRLFLRRYMPRVDSYLHYRLIDVSTVKELIKRWAPPVYKNVPAKKFAHRALDDIKESIDELKYYKQYICKE